MKYLELFKNGFDETLVEKVKPENYPYVEYSPNEGLRFSIIPNEDGTMYTIYKVVKKDISNCTYNMVDLGLPSGLKWADRNVGAASPEHYGSYFQWGDTNAYTFDGVGKVNAIELAAMLNLTFGSFLGEITADNVGTVLEQLGITGTDFTNLPGSPQGFSLDKVFNYDFYFDTPNGDGIGIKYNINGLDVLESVDDAATTHMGSQYRMPTTGEIRELINNTTWVFIDLGGIEYSQEQAENGAIEKGKLKGVRFTGSTGNSIFIPAAGNCYNYLLNNMQSTSNLWSSCLDASDVDYAGYLDINIGNVRYRGTSRCTGYSVRGVQP